MAVVTITDGGGVGAIARERHNGGISGSGLRGRGRARGRRGGKEERREGAPGATAASTGAAQAAARTKSAPLIRQTAARRRSQQDVLRARVVKFKAKGYPSIVSQWMEPMLQIAKSETLRFPKESSALRSWLTHVHLAMWSTHIDKQASLSDYQECAYAIGSSISRSRPVHVWSFFDTYATRPASLVSREFELPLFNAIVVRYEDEQKSERAETAKAAPVSRAHLPQPVSYAEGREWTDEARDEVVPRLFAGMDSYVHASPAPMMKMADMVPNCPFCAAKALPEWNDRNDRANDEGSSSRWKCSECPHEWGTRG